jgi:fucose 4-O-acetylase-like acetyltransferase
MKQRIEYIDVAKGIGIILVAIGHFVYRKNFDTQSVLFHWIYSFHMPLFFFISGLFFSATGGSKSFFIRKLRSLVVPYILFSIIQIILNIIEHDSIGIKRFIFYGWGNKSPMWFIVCLFEIEMLHYLILYQRKWRYPVIIMLIVFFLYKIIYNGWLPYSVSELPYFYTYFLMAYILRDKLMRMKNWNLIFLIFPVLWVIHWFILKYTLDYNPQYRVSDNDLLSFVLRYITSIIGLIATLLVSLLTSKYFIKKLFTWIGRNTLVILCTHLMIYDFLLWMNIQYISSEPFIYIEIIILSYITILIYNKLNPKLLKILHL